MTEEHNEISLQEYIIQLEEAVLEMKSDITKATANLQFCIETLEEMKDARWQCPCLLENEEEEK